MFNPAAAANAKAAKANKKKAVQNIREWSMNLVPADLRGGKHFALLSVLQETV